MRLPALTWRIGPSTYGMATMTMARVDRGLLIDCQSVSSGRTAARPARLRDCTYAYNSEGESISTGNMILVIWSGVNGESHGNWAKCSVTVLFSVMIC